MELDIIARCTYRGGTVVIPLFEHTKYADISTVFSSRFKELEFGGFKLTYSLPKCPYCMLESDMDVHLMLMCLSKLKSSVVDILAKVHGSLNKEVVAHVASDHSTSNRAAYNNAASGLAVANRAVSNHEMPNDAAFNHATPNPAMPDLAASDHVSLWSCKVESKSIDENEHLGNSGVHEGNGYLSQGWKEYIDHVGQKFEGGATEFRNKLRKYASVMGFRFVYTRNDKDRIFAECFKKSDGCNWHISGVLCHVNGFFYIRTLNNVHTCTSCIRGPKSKMMSSKVICSVIADQIREKPTIKPADIVKDFKQNYGLDISYRVAWRGTKLAKTTVHGDESLSYRQLVLYRDALMSTNPGSHCVLESDPESSRFRRLFVCCGACIEGFRWCRPLLFIDVTLLKRKYNEYLIGATGKDGNQGTFPFAFAIVDSENEENWSWFFENLAIVLNAQGRTITVVSDCNKGLAESVSKIFPASHHASCLQYLKQNLFSMYSSVFGNSFGNRIGDLFLKCAYAPSEAAFEFIMRNLKHEGGALLSTFLEDHPKEYWSYAYFKGNRYGEMYNKVSGSFSSWIAELSTFPICKVVDGIMIKLMALMAEKRCEAEKWDSVLCPEIERTLNDNLMVSRNCNVYRSSLSVFEVHHAKCSVMVDLDNNFCSCRQWQIKGFPCAHALAAIPENNGCIYDFVDDYFRSSYFRSSYATLISPIPDIKNVMHEIPDDSVILPPLTKKRPGRPRNK